MEPIKINWTSPYTAKRRVEAVSDATDLLQPLPQLIVDYECTPLCKGQWVFAIDPEIISTSLAIVVTPFLDDGRAEVRFIGWNGLYRCEREYLSISRVGLKTDTTRSWKIRQMLKGKGNDFITNICQQMEEYQSSFVAALLEHFLTRKEDRLSILKNRLALKTIETMENYTRDLLEEFEEACRRNEIKKWVLEAEIKFGGCDFSKSIVWSSGDEPLLQVLNSENFIRVPFDQNYKWEEIWAYPDSTEEQVLIRFLTADIIQEKKRIVPVCFEPATNLLWHLVFRSCTFIDEDGHATCTMTCIECSDPKQV